MSPKVTDAYREATRTQILRAAEKIFARKGYYAASVDDIVKESGLSKGALYGYFDSKEELFLALQALQDIARIDQAIAAMPATASATEKLLKTGHLAMEQAARLDRNSLRVSFEFWTSAPRIPSVRRYYEHWYYGYHKFLVGLLREGMARGEFRRDLEPDAVAWLLLAAVDGLCLHWAMIGVDIDWNAAERMLLSVVRDGILVPSKPSHPR
jgi:AcrR family transcriptional regulator